MIGVYLTGAAAKLHLPGMHLTLRGDHPREEVDEMTKLAIAMMGSRYGRLRVGTILLGATMAVGMAAQTAPPAPVASPASGAPVDPTAPTVANAPPAGTMSKGDLKEQRKQQKRDEGAAKATAKASKATAKSKEANDKALQAQEKAGQVTPAPAATTPPPAAPVNGPPR